MREEEEIVLQVKGLRKAYGDQEVLSNVGFTIARAERVAIVGPSGSGKSTLLNCLAGLESPDAGLIKFLGRNLQEMPESEVTALRRGQLTSVFQFFHLLPTLQASENVEFPLLLRNEKRTHRRQKVEAVMEEVGSPTGRRHYHPS